MKRLQVLSGLVSLTVRLTPSDVPRSERPRFKQRLEVGFPSNVKTVFASVSAGSPDLNVNLALPKNVFSHFTQEIQLTKSTHPVH